MTNEKAISMLHNLAESIDNLYKLNDDGKEVFEMAIEALKREQQFLDVGYRNERVEFYIGGRKFVVKEIAQ